MLAVDSGARRMSDLQDAVDRLTLPQTDHIALKDEQGRWLRAHTVVHPPLLQQMADRVNPSGNTGGGSDSASTSATRTPLDLQALYEFAKIDSAIRSWCRMAGAPTVRDSVVNLRAWFWHTWVINWDSKDSFRLSELARWEYQITSALTRTKQFAAPIPCPICGATSWGDAIDGGGLWSITVTYRLDDDDRMQGERALCRSCRTVWVGFDSIQELSEEVKEATG